MSPSETALGAGRGVRVVEHALLVGPDVDSEVSERREDDLVDRRREAARRLSLVLFEVLQQVAEHGGLLFQGTPHGCGIAVHGFRVVFDRDCFDEFGRAAIHGFHLV